MIKKTLASVAAVGLVLAAGATSAQAAGFPEKDITFVIPFKPGGGMDSTSRAVARVLGDHLPNKVNVVPKNVPGAGGKKGYGVLQRAQADGYTISVVNYPGAAMPSLTGENVTYDIGSFTWLARMSQSEYLLATNKKSGFKTLDDIKKSAKPAKITQTGFGSTAYAAAGVLKMVVGFKASHLTGYEGSKQYILGLIRGDGDLAVAPVQTFRKFIQSGDVVPIITFEAKPSIPGIMTAAQAGYPELTGLGVHRFIAGPPGMPENIRKILSDAIQKALADPITTAWAKKSKRPLHPMDADEADKEIKKSLAFYSKYKAALGKQ